MRTSGGELECLVDTDQATISVACWFVYCTLPVSLVMIEIPYFPEMLKLQAPMKFHTRKAHPKLIINGLKVIH